MSVFGDRFASGSLPRLMDLFGVPATWTPADNSEPVDLTVIASAEDIIEQVDADGTGLIRTRVITVGRVPGDAFGGVARPARGDRVEVDGETWTVDEVELTESTANARCSRTQAAEKSRPGWRRRNNT